MPWSVAARRLPVFNRNEIPMSDNTTSISQPPTPLDYGWDWVFRKLSYGMALVCISVVLLVVIQIAYSASPAISKRGVDFFTTDKWNPKEEEVGIRPQIFGTIYSSVL